MRTGGLMRIVRAFVGDCVRSLGVMLAAACAAVADAIDPPREWNPRLWDRNGDPRADNDERRP